MCTNNPIWDDLMQRDLTEGPGISLLTEPTVTTVSECGSKEGMLAMVLFGW